MSTKFRCPVSGYNIVIRLSVNHALRYRGESVALASRQSKSTLTSSFLQSLPKRRHDSMCASASAIDWALLRPRGDSMETVGTRAKVGVASAQRRNTVRVRWHRPEGGGTGLFSLRRQDRVKALRPAHSRLERRPASASADIRSRQLRHGGSGHLPGCESASSPVLRLIHAADIYF